MIISATVIKKPRRLRQCEECGKVINGTTLRLFGAAFYGDSPYAVFMHPSCCVWTHPKIIAAIESISPTVGQNEKASDSGG